MAVRGQWTPIGPTRINSGNGTIGRLTAIATDPTSSSILYVGARGCGVWKTSDGGATWKPIADEGIPTLAIVALGVDPSQHERVYAVTGDAGIFRSNDGGANWSRIHGHLGDHAAQPRIIVHPSNPLTLYHNNADGVYRSPDFGNLWFRVLSQKTFDLVFTPPNVLYAATPEGVFRTTTGGYGWIYLPGPTESDNINITLGLCRAQPNNLYACLSRPDSTKELWRTQDADNDTPLWTLVHTFTDTTFQNFTGVDPAEPRFVYHGAIYFHWSTDSGRNFQTGSDSHEKHNFATDPLVAGPIYVLGDAGIFRSTGRDNANDGLTLIGEGIQNTEMYAIATAATAPDLVMAGTQDNGSILRVGATTIWDHKVGGDAGTVAIDPTDERIIYGQRYKGQFLNEISRSYHGSPFVLIGADELPHSSIYHYQVHPSDHRILLASSGSLYRYFTNDFAAAQQDATWLPPIFAPPDPWEARRSAVDASVDLYYAGVTHDRPNQGAIWAGPSGTAWRPVFLNPSAGVTDLEVDLNEPTILYATFGGAGGGRVFRLRRASAAPISMSRMDVTGNLPTGLAAKCIAVDRTFPFTIYVGTQRGVYRGQSTGDAGTWTWTLYNDGLPPADVTDLEVHPHTGVIRAGTFGRGAFEVSTDVPIGDVGIIEGKVVFLRVHEVGTSYGSGDNSLDVEVVVKVDSQPWRALGFQLREDASQDEHEGTLDVLRDAFQDGVRVRIDYVRTGLRSGTVLRVATA